MRFDHRAFSLPKDIQHADQYQDAWAADGVCGVAAVADGVSSSLFAARWAQQLVEAIVAEAPDVTDSAALAAWLETPRRQWSEPVDQQQLAWHQKAKFAEGAFSTLLWVEVGGIAADPTEAGGRYPLRCYAIGDCCLFHVRGSQVLRAFPLENSALYDVQPGSLGSSPKQKAAGLQIDTLQDYGFPGDLLVLCTDALAVWALRQLETGKSPHWESFWTMPEDAWTEFLLRLRDEGQIRYDDTTALLLRLRDVPSGDSGYGAASEVLADVKENVKKGLKSLLSGARHHGR